VKIAVLVKQVPDPNAIRFDPRLGDLVAGTPQAANEYDLYAVEAALRLKELAGAAEVVVASVGSARETLNRCLAMGADRAVAIEGRGLPGDSLVTATVLAAWLRREAPQVIWVGQETSDGGTGNVGPQVAALLEIPLVSNVVGWEYRDGVLTLEREIEDGHQFQRVRPPALLCALSALDEPRLPTLRGIMDARRKPSERLSPTELGLRQEELTPIVSWGQLFVAEEKTAGVVLQGVEPDDAVEQVVSFLRERRLI
jgi:electron transfer flavoprotein beta subunit